MAIYRTKERRQIDCVIQCGQSNSEGGSAVGSPGATYTAVQANSNIYFRNNSITATDFWQNYFFTKNNNYRTVNLTASGPDISLGNKYFALTGRDLWIIKYAYGGSALVDVGVLQTNGLWQWDANPLYTNGLPHYTNLINNFVLPAISRASANRVDLNIKSFIWCQGESEAAGGDAYLTYESTLISLIDKIVTQIPAENLYSGFKPIITRIHNNFSPARPRQNEIRTALVNVANHYSAPWINSDGYDMDADLIHWTLNPTGQVQHGVDIATALASL